MRWPWSKAPLPEPHRPLRSRAEIEAEIDRLQRSGRSTVAGVLWDRGASTALLWVLGIPIDPPSTDYEDGVIAAGVKDEVKL